MAPPFMLLYSLWIATLLLMPATRAADATHGFCGQQSNIANTYCADWTIADGNITFNITAKTTGWFGLGFPRDSNTAGIMFPSDSMMLWVDGQGAVHASDRSNVAHQLPDIDAVQAVTALSGSVTNGVTTITVTRPLVPPVGSNDVTLTDDDNQTRIIWALGNDGDNDPANFVQHRETGQLSVNFLRQQLSNGTSHPSTPPSPPAATPSPPPSPPPSVTPTPPASPPPASSSNASFCSQQGSVPNTFCMTWFFAQDSTLSITLTAKTTGWVAIGFPKGTPGRMWPSDSIMCWVDTSGGVHVTDRSNIAYQTPQYDAVQTAHAVGGNVVGDTVTITFTRDLDTGSPDNVVITNSDMPIIWAVGNEGDRADPLSQHRERGAGTVNFYSGATTAQSLRNRPIVIAHAILMAIPWLLLIGVAVMFARFGKSMGPLWFKLHVGLSLFATACIITAFVLAVVMVRGNHAKNIDAVRGTHHLMGLLIFIFLFFQIALGVLADRMFNPERVSTPCFPDRTHWWFGRFLILLVIGNVFLGYVILQLNAWVYAVTGAWVGILLAIYIFVPVPSHPPPPPEDDDSIVTPVPPVDSNAARKTSTSGYAPRRTDPGNQPVRSVVW